MRAEVALLSRNIVIEGEVEDTCVPSNGNCDKENKDTFGGQLKVAFYSYSNKVKVTLSRFFQIMKLHLLSVTDSKYLFKVENVYYQQ